MRFSKSWIVTMKDLSVFKKKKYILYSLVALPFIVGLAVPSISLYSLQSQASRINRPQLLASAKLLVNVSSAYFVVIAAVLPTIIASYSFLGEKLEKSMEPLLATPITDSELLFGKSLAAFIPCMGATYIGTAIFAAIVDVWSYGNVGSYLLPNAYWAILVVGVTPLTCLLSVEANVIISSRVNDIRAAQQIGTLVILPVILFMILVSTNTSVPNTLMALITSGGLTIADIALFFMTEATFKREEILTKWK
jgi:ABC-2 type transport system permease protein